jgi:hypothetical protein
MPVACSFTITQGLVLLPLDFFLALEQPESEILFLDRLNIDKYRYLPQRKTFFNEHVLPVGFVVDEYLNKDYVGYTPAPLVTPRKLITNPKSFKAEWQKLKQLEL